jgi:membrane protein implicated in regulation of membrane protease activity
MDNPFIWIWLGLVIVFCIFEACTTSLTTIWFAGGAMVAFVLALFKVPEWIQMVVFVVVSVALLVLTRSFVMKILKVGTAKTNIDSLIGQKATVITDIDNSKDVGMVVVKGQKWSAKSKEFDLVIPEGTIVEVTEVVGVKLIVSIVPDKN